MHGTEPRNAAQEEGRHEFDSQLRRISNAAMGLVSRAGLGVAGHVRRMLAENPVDRLASV